MIKSIIQKYNHLESKHSGQLTNHLNMGLYALSQMSATETELHDFAKSYINKRSIESIKPCHMLITDENFSEWLGKEDSYSEFVGFFMKKIRNEDPSEVFTLYMNKLKEGFAGGAFHGLIRAAYAFELQDPEELAKSLAYLSESYLKFDVNLDELSKADPIDTILNFSKSEHFKTKIFKRTLITGRMIDVYEDRKFNATRLNNKQLNNENMYDLVLNLYALTLDFTILHGFTSTHALTVLEPILTGYEEVLQRHWFNLQIAYLSTKCTPILEDPIIDISLKWTDIFNKAKESDDVHDIKLTYSLFKMSEKYGRSSLAKTVAVKK